VVGIKVKRNDKNTVGVVLAAGEGRRFGALGRLFPKALCPVGNQLLLDLALDRIAGCVDESAVNVHHFRNEMVDFLRLSHPLVEVSLEEPRALGTAGALGQLREWIDGRSVVATNADAWVERTVNPFDGWSGDVVRVLVHGEEPFGRSSSIIASVLPWSVVSEMQSTPSGLYEIVWRQAAERGELDVVHIGGAFIDCGRPSDLLAANRGAVESVGSSIIDDTAIIGRNAKIEGSVIGAGARIDGEVIGSVVWPGQSVASGERLVNSMRVSPGFDVSD